MLDDDDAVLSKREILTLIQISRPFTFSFPWPQVYGTLPTTTLCLIDQGLIDVAEHGRTPGGLRLVRLTVSDMGLVLLRLLGEL